MPVWRVALACDGAVYGLTWLVQRQARTWVRRSVRPLKGALRIKGPDTQKADRDMQELMTLALRGVRPTREPLFGPRDEL